jgi:hypothetical protein
MNIINSLDPDFKFEKDLVRGYNSCLGLILVTCLEEVNFLNAEDLLGGVWHLLGP